MLSLYSWIVRTTVVPFTLYHGFILFPGAVDHIHGTFIFDTGAPYLALNGEYIEGRTDPAHPEYPVLDTTRWTRPHDPYPRPEGLRKQFDATPVVAHTIQVGDLAYALDPTDVGPPTPVHPTNANVAEDGRWGMFDRPVLGSFGLSAMEPFDIIIDYPNRTLTFVPLDSAGRWVETVSTYLPQWHVPLVDINGQLWGVRLSSSGDTTAAQQSPYSVDTGNAGDEEPLPGWENLTSHPLTIWDSVAIGPHIVRKVPNNGDPMQGYSLLSRLQIVSFNLRTRQFTVYRRNPANTP